MESPQVSSIPTTPTNPNIHIDMSRRRITWQQFAEERKCRSVQSAVPITAQGLGSSKNAEAKANVRLEKLANAHLRSTFCVLVIVAGLSIRMLNTVVTSLTSARLIHNTVDFLSIFVLMILGMAVYKKFHNQKVIW